MWLPTAAALAAGIVAGFASRAAGANPADARVALVGVVSLLVGAAATTWNARRERARRERLAAGGAVGVMAAEGTYLGAVGRAGLVAGAFALGLWLASQRWRASL